MCFWILGNVFRFWDVFWILESVFGFWDVFFILWEVFCPYEPPYINTDIGAKPAVTGLYLYYTAIKTTAPACGCGSGHSEQIFRIGCGARIASSQ